MLKEALFQLRVRAFVCVLDAGVHLNEAVTR